MSNNVTYATATYMCTWLTTPVDRGVDAMALKCTGGKTSASDAHVAYYVYDKTVEIIEQWPYSKVVSTVTETAKKDNRTEVLWNNIGKYEAAFWFDLKDDESERIGEMYTNPIDGRKWYKISRTSYTNHRAYMRLWLKKTDSAIDFYGEYEHSTKTYKFDTIDLVLNLANSDDIIDAIMAVYDGVKKEMVTEEIGRTIVFEYIYK